MMTLGHVLCAGAFACWDASQRACPMPSQDCESGSLVWIRFDFLAKRALSAIDRNADTRCEPETFHI